MPDLYLSKIASKVDEGYQAYRKGDSLDCIKQRLRVQGMQHEEVLEISGQILDRVMADRDGESQLKETLERSFGLILIMAGIAIGYMFWGNIESYIVIGMAPITLIFGGLYMLKHGA